MPWNLASGTAGGQQIENVETVQRHPWGKIVEAFHETYGQGEFIYVKGVSGGFAGAMVIYNTSNGLTILAPAAISYGGAPVCVLVAALDAVTKFGWGQIGGDAVVKKTAVAVVPSTGATNVFLSGTAGRVMPTSVASRRVLGARFTNLTSILAATSIAVVNLQRPHIQSAP